MQNQERQLPTVGNRVYFDNREEPAQSGWYLLHRVRNVSGSIDSPDALLTLCRENNEPGEYISALASEISLTGPQTPPSEPAEEWPHGATVKLQYSFSGDIGWAKRDTQGRLVSAYSQLPLDQSQWTVLAERKPADADLCTRLKSEREAVLTEAEYVAKGGCHCPNCHSSKITAGSSTIDGATAYFSVSCETCNAEWTDVYHLAGYSDLVAD